MVYRSTCTEQQHAGQQQHYAAGLVITLRNVIKQSHIQILKAYLLDHENPIVVPVLIP